MLVALYLFLLVSLGGYLAFGVFYSPMLLEMGWSRTLTAAVFSTASLIYAGFQIAFGRLVDRFGPARVILIGGLLYGVGLGGMALVRDFWQAVLLYGLGVGVGLGGVYLPVVVAVHRLYQGREGVPLGFLVTAQGVSTALVSLIGARLANQFSWRMAFAGIGLGTLVCTVLAVVALQGALGRTGTGGLAAAAPDQSPPGLTFNQALQTWPAWQLLLVNLLVSAAAGVGVVHIVAHAQDIGVSPPWAAAGFSFFGLGRVMGSPLAGWTCGRFPRRWVLASVSAGIGVSLLAVLLVRGGGVYMAALLALGAAYSGVFVTLPIITAEYFGSAHNGVIFGFINAGYGVGNVLGPMLAGAVRDLSGTYAAAFLTAGGMGLAGSLLATAVLPPPRRGPGGDPTSSLI